MSFFKSSRPKVQFGSQPENSLPPQPQADSPLPSAAPQSQYQPAVPPVAAPAAQSVVEDVDHSHVVNGKIRDLSFSDLMLWPDGRGFLRHVVGYKGPIIAVPAGFHGDIVAILNAINSEARDKEFFFRHDGVPYRVARIDTIDGSGYFMRRPKYPVPPLNSLGLPPAMAETLLKLGKTSGLVLIAGATGSGKSTTMYSLLNQLVTINGDIAVAVEDPPEIPVQGIYGDKGQGLWYQIDAHTAGGFETAMIAAMRYNPRYIMLGEIRAPKVANEAIRAAVNGHLVLATIHGSSIPGAIMALQQIAAASSGSQELARSILADGLAAVIQQELVPDPEKPGQRKLVAEMLCFGNEHGLRAKIRGGKLEHLSSDIEAQQMRIQRGQLPVDI
ncbi:Nucleotide binding protein [Yersinia mollaretii ATCC 43969]|uniref:Nucleotide binding protein n=1 Tax=Yersinia mollaretii (strain ATCC 43969 / DSM 18520 / CIP 103324 / CNY 7263 / WAIP 204) TaxID=349967 RepID=A0ABP2EH62_YERMW|nr:Nucleotide binding protein [Yersinia mollaretii ATCC 43969]